jgi:hypothetical protein
MMNARDESVGEIAVIVQKLGQMGGEVCGFEFRAWSLI